MTNEDNTDGADQQLDGPLQQARRGVVFSAPITRALLGVGPKANRVRPWFAGPPYHRESIRGRTATADALRGFLDSAAACADAPAGRCPPSFDDGRSLLAGTVHRRPCLTASVIDALIASEAG
jgi:hypothetical protein